MNTKAQLTFLTSAFWLMTATALAQPIITNQPTSQSVSLGAHVTFLADATGTLPLSYQWRFDGVNLMSATNRSLAINQAQPTDAGDYAVIVANSSGSVTSRLAHLEVDTTFTKITTGSIVNDGGFSISCAWGDYDDDGFIDLFVTNWGDARTTGGGFLYHNNRGLSFTRILSGPPVNNTAWLNSAAWGDYDNDGFIDLYVTTWDDSHDLPNFLYHNNGNGTFTRVLNSTLARQVQGSLAAVWGDFDNDGWLDLFVANGYSRTDGQSLDNILYRNDAQGDFIPISFGTKPFGADYSFSAAWGDFDNDGFLDLAVPQGGLPASQRALLYHNNRNGTLTLLKNSAVSADVLNGEGCAWGDYDNDGWLDLCVGNFYGENNSLFHNNRDGTFTKITNSIVALDGGTTKGVAWGDYDNDGWLDLFVSNLGPFDPRTFQNLGKEPNFLYHNNGDGTFTKIASGSLVNELGNCGGAAWGDYDNDGFLDLFVANGFFVTNANNVLYRNNGNSNSWLNLRLIGTVSNRSAIGAKVRVLATIRGKTFWQLREISGGSSFGSQNDMRANFGLGDATNTDIVRIEWPSGLVQTMTNVPAKQFLTVFEHQEPFPTNRPSFTSESRSTGGVVNLSVSGETDLLYVFEASTNLVNWTRLGVRTNLTGSIQFADSKATNYAKRFYRVAVP
jgi:hypothetical protein